MSDITTGTVYKIICKLDHKFVYIGSTFDTLRNRWQNHKGHYRDWIKDPETGKCACAPYFKKYGIDNFKILEIRKYDIHLKDRRCLLAYEMLWINKTRGCCNIYPPIQYFKKEQKKLYREDNKTEINKKKKDYYESNKTEVLEKCKLYREVNKTEIAERKKVYREANNDTIREKKKVYREANKTEIAEKKKTYNKANKTEIAVRKKAYYEDHKTEVLEKCKLYREVNKTEIAERKKVKVTCGCGSTVRKADLSRHNKTEKHQAFLATQI